MVLRRGFYPGDFVQEGFCPFPALMPLTYLVIAANAEKSKPDEL